MTAIHAVELIDAPDHVLASRVVGAGDRSAFGVLYLRHHEAAWRMACVATGFTADAELAVVDGFARVFEELPTDGGLESAFRRYLLHCVRRAAIDRLRRTGRVDPRGAFPADPLGTQGDAGKTCLAGSQESDVAQVLRLLPEQWRTILWLTEVERMTPPETSVVADVELHTVTHIATLAWDEVRDCCATLHRELTDPQTSLLTAALPVPLLGGDAQQRWLATSGQRRQENRPGPASLPRHSAGSRHERSRLDPLASSVAAARRFTEATLVRWGITEVLEVAQLLTSELVTNAVVHARSDIELALNLNTDVLRVEVRDRSAVLPSTEGSAVDANSGRGIRVLDSLADRWGAQRTGERKVVWFEVTLSETDAAA